MEFNIKRNLYSGDMYCNFKHDNEKFYANFAAHPMRDPACTIYTCNEDGSVNFSDKRYEKRAKSFSEKSFVELLKDFTKEA